MFAIPPKAVIRQRGCDDRFSNRPVGVKRFQTVHDCGVDVARGLVLLYGIGAKAVPSWDSKTRRNNLRGGLAVSCRQVQADMRMSSGSTSVTKSGMSSTSSLIRAS